LRVLVAGAGGLVGRAVASHCGARGDEVLAATHSSLDIADASAVESVIQRFRPEAAINCAAWTDVDACESNAQKAFAVNAEGPENLAAACRRTGAQLITISTDYVFDGMKEGFYTQRDDPNPLSVYGKSKLEGERRAQTACSRTTIVRTGWIFGPGGTNFLSKVIELSERGVRLNAISDSWGTPTYAVDLAKRLRELADVDVPGFYHVVNAGEGSTYYDFARESLERAGLDPSVVAPINAATLTRPAPRPRNSRLLCLLSEALGLEPMRSWKECLTEFAFSART
jgi:dTDP-4-dehydrorhamnose reductase